MTFDELWPMEQSLWLGGQAEYEALLHPQCLMAFAKVGVLEADAVEQSVRGPRWSTVSPSDVVISGINGDLVVVGYRAEARREGAPVYRCVCTSTYTRAAGGWRIVQHQQSVEN